MFDIFYSGKKPGLFAHEREATDIEHAQQLSRTRFFWWITYLADLSKWDFLWEPVPWQADQRHAWCSQHQIDAGVYLVPATGYTATHYHTDRSITRLSAVDNWHIPAGIDQSSFDFSWHPDYTEPAYEYHFGTQWQSAGGPVYPGSQGIKLVHTQRARATRQYAYWKCPDHVNFDRVDYSWHPNPLDPPYIYHFASNWQPASGVTYTVPGATEVKLIDPFVVITLPTNTHWSVPGTVVYNRVNYSWHPNPLDPPYIYHFPDQHQAVSGVTYTVPGATEIKLVDAFQVKSLPSKLNWFIPASVDSASVDYSWHPNPLDPPYIYYFPSQYQQASGVTYTVPGATEIKLVDAFQVKSLPSKLNWLTPASVDAASVDYSWQPDLLAPPYIYHFASQWSSSGGVTYTVPGATEIKLVDAFRVKTLPSKQNWSVPANIKADSVDYSWHADPFAPPYIYHFPSQYQSASGVTYTVPGATEIKLVDAFCVKHLSNKLNWTVPPTVIESSVDYSWHPNPLDPPYVYHFGSQWSASSGVTYTVPGATEIKLVDAFRVKPVPDKTNWTVPAHIANNSVDYSWQPDPLAPPYVYHFGSKWQSATGVTYTVPGATEIKLVDAFRVKSLPNKTNWSVSKYIAPNSVDYTWHPDPLAPPYIYHFGSQWSASSGVTYTVPGATEIKLVDAFQVKPLPNTLNWTVPAYIAHNSVNYSWQPDPLAPPYVYHFGSQWQTASGVTYTVPGATEVKLVNAFCVRAIANPDAWTNTDNIVYFDYSWHPDVLDPAYIYEFGTQWYDEGGPVYTVSSAVDRKYVDSPRAQLKGTTENWQVLHPIDAKSFNWSWQPHPKDPPFIYVWGNNYWPAEKMPTIEYHVPGATERKYMAGTVKLSACADNWQIPDLVSADSINYTWVPDPQDPPYIYEFATQWQHNGGAQYVVPGATETKYIDQGHRRIPDLAHWHVPHPVESFDYSWHPDNTEEPYNYEFATQWQSNGGPVYQVPGAVKTKYIDIVARRLPNEHNWQVLEPITDFDYSWHPNNAEEPYIYVFGNQHYPGTIMPTVRYVVPGATTEKFVDAPVAQLADTRLNWEMLEPIDEVAWDWTWRPNPKDPPFIYMFGNQWNPAEYKASVRYVVPGATEVKYLEARTVRLPDPTAFEQRWPNMQFDWSWEPNPFDPPYTYVFGNQWNSGVIEPTVIYMCDGGTEYKYIDELVATLAPDPVAFETLDAIESFDYSWRPNPKDPPYLYVFGNQWLTPEQRPAVQYRVGSATEIKYMDFPKAYRTADPELFVTHHACEFDYSWEPDPGSPPYVYVFGNQHWPAEVMPTIEYAVPGATERKYMLEPVAKLAEHDRWIDTATVPFEHDRSWVPDPGDPPFVYVFGNQWHAAEEMSTVEYHVPGATERKFVDAVRARLLPAMDRWSIPEEINADNVDFSWHPHPQEDPYIHHFGSEFQMSIGLTYTVPGATELKFAGDPPLKAAEKKAVAVLDIFYLDRSNASSAQRFARLQERYPHIQKVRFVNSAMDTIRRCLAKTKNQRFWVIGSENDYSDFDFAWHAQPWQGYMTHVFGSQWNKWSDTFLINKWEFERNAKWAKGIEEFPNLNFVTDQQVHAPADASPVYVLDHGNADHTYLQDRCRVVRSARYFDNYLDSLRRLLDGVQEQHIWVVSSLCDYTRFDFSWQPEAWQRDMLHVFPSNEQKFGDTFYVPVQSLRDKIDSIELLDWFETVNYCNEQQVERLPIPVVMHTADSHVDAVLANTLIDPLVLYTNRPVNLKHIPTVSLWRDKTKTIVPLDTGAGAVIVPKYAIPYIKTQLYDYPYIDKTQRAVFAPELQDVIFISYDEPDADANWEILKARCPRAQRIHGVAGMEKALEAAADAASTPWYYAVFAKTRLENTFDFSFVPDRMQQPKHYIFNCRNSVNQLEYGHMGVVLYNCNGIRQLNQQGNFGLDYTMSFPNESIPILSCHGDFNTTPYHTWRTAFRESAKLAYFESQSPTVEGNYRLNAWQTLAQGNHAEWCLKGSKDGVEFFQSTNGDLDMLKQSFKWEWLRAYFVSHYGNLE